MPRGKNYDRPPGEMRVIMEHANYWMGQKKPETDEERIDRIKDYFRWCEANDVGACVQGLGLAMQVDRHTIANWRNEKYRKGNEDLLTAIKNAYVVFDYIWVKDARNMHPALAVFLGANNLGYRDIKEQVIHTEPQDPLGDLPNEERRRAIAASVPRLSEGE